LVLDFQTNLWENGYMTDELFIRLAADLVEAHNSKSINLNYWPSARELVTHYYEGEAPIKFVSSGVDWNGEEFAS
jgi:hypothetical protein